MKPVKATVHTVRGQKSGIKRQCGRMSGEGIPSMTVRGQEEGHFLPSIVKYTPAARPLLVCMNVSQAIIIRFYFMCFLASSLASGHYFLHVS